MCPNGQRTPGRQRAWWPALAIVAFAFGARVPVAFAAPSESPAERGLELSWDAPRGCADAKALRRDVDVVVGTTGEVRRRNVQVHGEVKRDAEGWTATLVLVTDAGRSTRTLTAPSCHVLVRAAAVVIAFAMTEQDSAIDPVADANEAIADAADHDRPAKPPPHVETSRLPPKSEKPRAPASPPGRRLGPTVGAFVRADAGTLPNVALGPGVVVGWHAQPILLEATFGWLLGQSDAIVSPPQRQATIARAEFAAFFARTAICPASPSTSIAWRRLHVLACAGFGAIETQVSGRRIGGTRADQIDAWSGSAFVGPRLRFAPGPFAISASADVAVPFRRQEFTLVDRSGGALSVHRSSAVLVGISLGIELTFFQ